ncbi:MAG TPA: AAA family ATPase, partial [Algoriphagus sp.]|nr:AAA family ATPase [Algoriphagus sp.]
MTNAIYLTTTEPFSGKSIFALGLMSLLASKTDKLAYFKPIISGGKKEKDRRLDLIKNHFNLSQSYEDMFVFSRKKAIKEINNGNEAFLIDSIIEKFKKLQESSDFVVVEGTDFINANTNVEFDGNIAIAKNLGIPAAIILNCSRRSVPEIVDLAQATIKGFLNKGVQVLVLVANKVEEGKEEEIAKRLQAVIPPETLVTTLPMHVELSNPTMGE